MKGRLGTLVFVALGLLLAAVAGQYFARVDSKANPAANSIRPSGTSTFAELLRQKGFKVRIDRKLKPKVRPGEAAIVFKTIDVPFSFFGQETTDPRTRDAEKAVTDQVREGAGQVILPFGGDFENAVRLAEASPFTTYRASDDAKRTLVANSHAAPAAMDRNRTLYSSEVGEDIAFGSTGKGISVVFGDGHVATNRLIDKGDNAQLLLEAVQLASPTKSVVFTEATFDVQPLGFLETVGRWSQALVYQTLFLIAVAVFTLGRRFGLEDISRRAVRSSRDLADGIADTLKRGRMAGTALGILLEDAQRRRGHVPSNEAKAMMQVGKVAEEDAVRVAKESL